MSGFKGKLYKLIKWMRRTSFDRHFLDDGHSARRREAIYRSGATHHIRTNIMKTKKKVTWAREQSPAQRI